MQSKDLKTLCLMYGYGLEKLYDQDFERLERNVSGSYMSRFEQPSRGGWEPSIQ